MTISTLTKDEREILLRLCDDLAAKVSPLYKQAHLILKGTLEAPHNDELRQAAISAKAFLRGDLTEPGRTVFWKLTDALNASKSTKGAV